ncbi:MAG: arsenite methyltransferase [Phycisphaeraceae bacterium]
MPEEITAIVREKYGQTARAGLSSEDAGVAAVAEAFGYSADELASIPAASNMGLSCGNPIALANLKEGETVVDLGSGGGLDVFLAANKIGPSGKAIGIDMTPDMIDLARRNAATGVDGKPYKNVEFRLGQIDALPLPDHSADVIISNCVINLADDKQRVFEEMYRALKPGGRVAVSDIALKEELPEELAQNIAAHVGCIAGAISIDAFASGLRLAGFKDVAVIDTQSDLTAYAAVDGQAGCCSPAPASNVGLSIGESDADSACCSPGCCDTPDTTDQAPAPKPMHADLGELFERYDINRYAASVKVFAVK